MSAHLRAVTTILRRRPILTGVLLAFCSIASALVLIEIALRVSGFEYHLMPEVQFGWPDPQAIERRYVADPDLFWVTRDYKEKLRAARRMHPAIVFMGDSCTEFGTYPAQTLAWLTAAGSPATTGVHLAVGGWSSEQGLAQLQRDVVRIRPRVAVIYYGWNDHWIALGPTDPSLRVVRRMLWLSEHLRIIQMGLKATVGVAAASDQRPNRVPADRYRQNLQKMARLARNAGIVPVLVTAPSNYVPGHEPPYLLRRHVLRLADVVPLHQQYVELTREAAITSGAILCDAARTFDQLPQPHDRFFQRDGIHLTSAGDHQLAAVVGKCIIDGLRQTLPKGEM